jgi:hypothetical protein
MRLPLIDERTTVYKKVAGIISFTLLCLFCVSACNEKSKPDLRFAFIGDVHYAMPDYRTADYLVPAVAKELDSLRVKPEFIIQTGDFFNAGKGVDVESEAAFAFKNFEERIGMPFFIAKGNHDSRGAYEKNALPVFSRESGNSVSKSYYSFSKANCHFVMLDCTDEKLADQLAWLEKDLETAKTNTKIEHIFVAGHYPLWIVARAGFTRPEYSDPVASLLARYKVDAYFCGHTHNKTATVRLINGQPLTQIMDAGVVEEGRLFNLAPFLHHVKTEPKDLSRPGILPLEEGHQIFIPESELKYYWGYQEGSTTSYYLITVDGKSVQADWHVLGQGVVRSFKWDQPGKPVDLKSPVHIDNNPLTDSDLKQIEKAWFYVAPWTDEDSINAPFSINNVPAGMLEMSRAKMAGSPFWNKIEVPLTRSVIDAIKTENEISFTNPAKGKFGLAHMFLLVQFRDGRFARSSISQKVMTSFPASEGQYKNFPDADLIESVTTGKPLQKVILRFDQFYNN